MSFFDNISNDNDIVEDSDNLGGGGGFILDSDVYKFRIKYAFIIRSAKGATGISLHLETEDGKPFRPTLYVTSGTDKGCKNFFIKKDKSTGKETKHYLPGFNQANAICLLTVKKELKALGGADSVKKAVINLRDYTLQKDVPTEVDMIMPLIGKEFCAGVIKQLKDKNALNDATGQYEPTGETREENEIDRIFCAVPSHMHLTLVEVRAEETVPAFYGKWIETWKGKVKDRTSKDTAKNGAPRAGVETGAQAPTTALFS